MRYFIYDLETLYNLFSFAGKFVGENEVYYFEISDRINQTHELIQFLQGLQRDGVTMVGYNSIGFDYPILHAFMQQPYTFGCKGAYDMCQKIIGGQTYGNAGAYTIWKKDRMIDQLDIVKMLHFDNKAKRTSLKSLQVAMRSPTVEDMPVPLGVPISVEQMELVKTYNIHDVTETEKFFLKNMAAVEMRTEFLNAGVLQGDVMNFSDVKIGEQFMVSRLGRNKCYSGSKPKNTTRSKIALKNLLLPKIQFRDDEFQAVRDWFGEQVIDLNAKVPKPKLTKELADVDFVFGLGGVHASRHNKVYRSNDTHEVIDIDVAGMYVAVGIANGYYPEHLGQDFVRVYKGLQQERKQYAKGTSMNALLKLAGNGVYGNSNNPYSPFYDTKYTYSVTITGQLQLLQLVEAIHTIPGLEIIQANTDGITVYLPREYRNQFNMWCQWWEELTGLVLEFIDYQGMWIADVNNYIAQTTDGKVKLKGRYWYPKNEKDYEGVWNKDFGNMLRQKVAERVLVHGDKLADVIRLVSDPYDLLLSYKAKGGAQVFIGDTEQQKTTRYYVSTSGQPMKKVASPKGPIGQYKRKSKLTDAYYESILSQIGEGIWDERIHTKNKSTYQIVETSIQSGRLVKECNNINKFNWNDVDWDYYITETEKLLCLS